jgi:hypothetical protein
MAIPRKVPDGNILHVVPCQDDREHDTESRGKCWCRPEIDEDGLDWVVNHVAWDGRHDYYSGRRKPH